MGISKYEPAYGALMIRLDILEPAEKEWMRQFADKCVRKIGHQHIATMKRNDGAWICIDDYVLEDVDLSLSVSHFVGEVEERLTRPKPKRHKDGSEVRILEHKDNSEDFEK